jgi:tetratricopeptide (TPR) repeat protein
VAGSNRAGSLTKMAPRRAAGSLPAPDRGAGSRRPWLAAGLIALLLALALYFATSAPRPPPASAPAEPAAGADAAASSRPTYVGGAACAGCHAGEHAAWQGSHHDRAMAEASEASMLGDFSGAKFSHAGVTSTFFRRDGRFFVNTDGPDGRLADFEIKYAFGVEPLQQYLVELEGGRLQALGIAWDSRPVEQGGQRWFHLYPDGTPKAGDPLHWTGIEQVWNYQCADCHSTNLRKNYDAATNRYATTWTDIDVGCEACHGPGSNHIAWARHEGDWQRDAAKGLTVALDERRGASWVIDPRTGDALRSKPRGSAREIETCARCHARRGQFSDAWHAGQPLGDGFRASLIEPGLYYDDGQMRDEVYNYGSFLASRMHAQGVTCSDCHDPHSARLRAPGNGVCGQCHLPAKYDGPSHHRHAPGTAGAACAACHMPATTYMVVDPRHDHGFRIPRPDRTMTLGIPNACNGCHADRKPQWAVAALNAWYPQPKAGFQVFAEALSAGDSGAPGAQRMLAALVADRQQPAIARASAAQRLGRFPGAATLTVLRGALADPDAAVRAAAVEGLADVDPVLRAELLAPMLADTVRLVRIAAARALAGAPETRLSPRQRATFASVLEEYVAAERFNADRPEGRANLGNLHAAQGRHEEAAAAFRAALALDPGFVQAALNLADLQRGLDRESEAEQTLRAALARDPDTAAVRFALGLSLVRQKRTPEALGELAAAARLAPDNARFAYVHGVALKDGGKPEAARRVFENALKRHPYDRDLLLALATFERDAGRAGKALAYARRLAEVAPENPDIRRLVVQLGGPDS